MIKDNAITQIGITNWRNKNIPFGIKDTDRLRHVYAIGKTGSGKSTLLATMAISDIKKGNALCILDPHGDIVEQVLNYIPKERVKDVIYFDATNKECSIAFNPLHQQHVSNDLLASGLVNTFKRIWSESWGPRLEYILQFSILTLLHRPGAIISDILQLLTDKEYREQILETISDAYILQFWSNEFDRYPYTLRIEAITPILNKIGQFVTHDALRNICGQKMSSFNIDDSLQEKKIILCKLSKGAIGDEASSLLGSMLLTTIQHAVMRRSSIPEEERTPFYVYVDEMHSFVSLSFVSILAEARKYGLSLFLTHQYIDQVNEKIRTAVFGNVGTVISFQLGSDDAAQMEKEFLPVFNATDLLTLSKHSIYIKLMIDGSTSKPFSATTLPLPGVDISYKGEVIETSRKLYTTMLPRVIPTVEYNHVKDQVPTKTLFE
jgi:energy-coupling factor transporter ATP-binding protein EcfA2